MKTRRILSMLLCICMLAGTVLQTGTAYALTESVTENIEEISSYSVAETNTSTNELLIPVEQKTEVPEGYIGIYTAEDLDNVRNDLNANYILMADIDLAEYDNWLPIGAEPIQTLSDYSSVQYSRFSGIFDGNGYSIKNMSITDAGKENIGLFAMIGSNMDGDNVGQLKNILLENILISIESIENVSYKIGGIVGCAYAGNIYNCAVTGKIDITGSETWLNVGGIVGYSLSQIICCKSLLDITSRYNTDSSYAKTFGGIVGSMYYNTDIIDEIAVGNCISYSNITLNGGTGTVGGIVGEANSRYENIYQISGNINFGNLEAKTQYDCMVAGVVGEISSADYSGIKVLKSQNCGSIYSSNEAAGICGRVMTEDTAKSCSIEYCANTGDITVVSEENTENYSVCAGGIVANISLNSVNSDEDSSDDSNSVLLISNCYNSGNINAISNYSDDRNSTYSCPVGSIVGSIWADTFEFEINSCYVSGKIFVENIDDAIDFQIGSIIGALESKAYYAINNCYVIDALDFDAINYKYVSNEYTVGCSVLSDEEMQLADSFVGFDFDSVWEIGKAEDYNYPTLIDNPHRGIAVEPEIPEEPSEITSTWDTTAVTLSDFYSFVGSVSTTAENGLDELQVKINSATDNTIIINYYNKHYFPTREFDLSNIPSLSVNDELYDDGSYDYGDTPIIIEPGSIWNIQLVATDNDGNTLSESITLTVADEQTSGSFTYVVNEKEKTATITGFIGDDSVDLIIPNEIDGYIVKNIGYRAFGSSWYLGSGNKFSSLTLPDSLVSIDDYAFYRCDRLTGSLIIPNSVTSIGGGAFADCSGFDGSLVISRSLTSIASSVFSGCNFTGDLIIPDSVTFIGSNAFSECRGFTGSLIIPESVTTIGDDAFSSCTGFTGNLIIPNSVKTIGDWAFAWCSGFTGSLTIPNSVTTIGDHAFGSCSGFTGTLTIPNSVTTIGDYAFAWCSGFTGSLTIPNSVTTIGDNAFYSCTGFTGTLTIPNSVTYIGDDAFAWCSGFTGSLTIPDSVTSIKRNAFMGCENIQIAYFNGNVPTTWEDTVLPEEVVIYYPEGNTSGWTSPTWTAPDGTVYNTMTFNPNGSSMTSNWDTTAVTLNEGEVYSFVGSVSTTAENGLKDLQININSATDDTVGIMHFRAPNIGLANFDLSAVQSLTVNATLSDEEQTIVLAPGTTWEVQLFATDTDGNSIGDAEIMILTIAEGEIQTGRPTVEGLSNSYTITLGESLTLAGTISAFGEGRLNKVTLQHNEEGSIFVPQTQNIALASATADLSYFTISADEYPLNTVGTHEFIIYASADNFTDTDNRIMHFNVTVNSNDHICTWSSGKDVTGTGIYAYVDSKTHIRESVEKEYECLVCGATKIERVLGKDEYPPAVPEPHRTNYQKIKATYYEKLETSHDDYTTKHKVVNVLDLECNAKGCGYTIPGGEKYTYENHNLKDGVCTACGFGSSIEDFIMDKDCHYVLVSNKDGEVISGAKVSIRMNGYKTDENGFVAYPVTSDIQTSGYSLVTVNADGYKTKQLLSKLNRGEVDIVFLEEDLGDSAPYFLMLNDFGENDLTAEQVWFTENNDKELSVYSSVDWKSWDTGEVVVYQEGGTFEKRGHPVLYLCPGKDLDPSKPVYACIEYGLNRRTEPVELKIGIVKVGNYGSGITGGSLENLTGFKIAEDCTGSVADSNALRFFPGDFELTTPIFPVQLSREIGSDGSVSHKVIIGLADYDWDKDEGNFGLIVSTIQKELGKFYKISEFDETPIWDKNMTCLDLMESFGAKSGSFTVEKKIMNTELKAVGYYEIQKDKNGNEIKNSGGFVGSAQTTLGKLTKQFWTPIGPVYFEVNGEVGGELVFGLANYTETKGWEYDGSIAVNGKMSVGGGYGIAKIATLGLSGNGGIDINILPDWKGVLSASANLELFIWGIVDYNVPLAYDEWTLWGGEQTRTMMSLRALNNGGSVSLASRDYTSKTSEWNGYPVALMSLEESPETFTTLQEYIMPNTLPELVRVGNKYILLFQTDDSERQAGNNIVLMYSVYDENIGGWAEPLPVSEGVSSDFYPEIFVHNDELYVAWLKLPNEVSSEDAESLMNEISGGVDISFAKWNKAENKFEQSYVNSDDKLDMMPYLAFGEDKITAVWISNSNSNIMEDSGVESIMTSSLVNGEWTEPVELYTLDKYISEVVAGYVDGELVVFYSVNEEDVLENVYMLSNGTSTLVPGQTAYGTSLNFYDGRFYWITEGILNEYDVSSDTLSTITSGDSKVINSSYRFVKNNSDTAIVWLSTTDDESIIYASIKTENGFSNPFVILSTSDYSIKYMDVELEDDGTWKLVLNTLETSDSDIDKTSMVCVDVNVRENTTLDYVIFDERDRVDGVQPMTLYLTNEGQNTVANVKVEIKDLNGNSYYSNVETCSINAGETKEIDITVDFSSISELTDIKIYAHPENESDRTDNNISEEIGHVDVSFNVEHYYVENNLVLATTISNISDISADVVISIIEDSEDGKIVTAKKITGITNTEDYVFLYSIDREDIDFGEEGYKRYFIMIEPLMEDFVESDNSDIISVYPVNSIKEEHKHSVNSEYNFDNNNHWQSCVECNEHIGVESHIESEWIIDIEATSNNKGARHTECIVCGYVIKSEEIPETDIPPYLLWAYIQSLKNKTYTIEADAGNGGTISNVGKTEVKHGETYTYFITPNEGYSIKAVYIDGVDIGAVTEYTFSNITSPKKIYVEFIKNKPEIETPSIEIKTTVFSIKNVVAGEIANAIPEFKYKLILDDENINGVYGDVIFSNGIAKFTMENNSEVVVTDLPVGLKYVVIQEDQENYITSTIATEGILTSEHVNAYFINIANKPSDDIIENPVTSDDEN